MDVKTYEQPILSDEVLGDLVNYLKEGVMVELELYEGEPVNVEMPITVELAVVEAPPGYAGDTASGATKEVVTETGLKVTVPLFISTDDVIRVDTRTGEYLTRT